MNIKYEIEEQPVIVLNYTHEPICKTDDNNKEIINVIHHFYNDKIPLRIRIRENKLRNTISLNVQCGYLNFYEAGYTCTLQEAKTICENKLKEFIDQIMQEIKNIL